MVFTWLARCRNGSAGATPCRAGASPGDPPRPRRLTLVLCLTATLTAASAATSADREALLRGQQEFRAQGCAACHQIGAEAQSRSAPHLQNLAGRVAGALAGARYSDALREAGRRGLRWEDESLDHFLRAPRDLVPGTAMPAQGIAQPQARTALIAFLLAGDGSRGQAEVELPDGILATPGDAELGAYLAAECTGCHVPDAKNAAIPSLTGWTPEAFMRALYAYKQGLRTHQVMQMLAERLADDEIAALAAYFARQQ